MAEAENIAVEVKPDISDIDSSVKEVAEKFDILQDSVVNLGKEVSDNFKKNITATQDIKKVVDQSATRITDAIGALMGAVTGAIADLATKLDNILQSVGGIKSNSEQQNGDNFLTKLGDKVTDKAVDLAGEYVYEKIGGGQKQEGNDDKQKPDMSDSGASGILGGVLAGD